MSLIERYRKGSDVAEFDWHASSREHCLWYPILSSPYKRSLFRLRSSRFDGASVGSKSPLLTVATRSAGRPAIGRLCRSLVRSGHSYSNRANRSALRTLLPPERLDSTMRFKPSRVSNRFRPVRIVTPLPLAERLEQAESRDYCLRLHSTVRSVSRAESPVYSVGSVSASSSAAERISVMRSSSLRSSGKLRSP